MILTGDLHANASGELQYLTPEYLRNKYGSGCENTFIIVLGDGGFLWYNDLYSDFNGELINTLDQYLHELNSKMIVIPGNHENYRRIYSLPKVHYDFSEDPILGYKRDSEGDLKGDFREISKYIMYTERFGEYEIEGHNILVLGGARSLDQSMRENGKTWFIEETFSIEEKDFIFENLCRDHEYVFAHTCPYFILRKIYEPESLKFRDNNSEFFSKLMNYMSCKTWFFGHLHPRIIDGEYNHGNFDDLCEEGTNYICLYKSIQSKI